jgi:hypothetical protein
MKSPHTYRASFHEAKTLGGAMGIRTPDLLNAIEALYQLSYDPQSVSVCRSFETGSPKELHRLW